MERLTLHARLLLGFTAACTPAATLPRPGVPLALEVVGGAQMGLSYHRKVALGVRYRTDDAAQAPIGGATVHFSIFGDPQGSTLSSDRATTDGAGLAQVELTAGAAEAAFRVTVSAANAADTEFDVSVSAQPFVELDVEVRFAGPPMAATLDARLYTDLACAALAPTPTAPPPLFILTQTGGSEARFAFAKLVSKSYAVLGRAEDPAGRLLASECVDVPAALIPSGSTRSLPLELVRVVPSPVGAFTLTSLFTTQPSSPAARGDWHALSDCPLAPADPLLDALSAQLSGGLRAAVDGARGALGANGCRPATLASGASLDGALSTLLQMGPAAQLPALVADFDAITGAATVTSTFTITTAGGARLDGEHALRTLALAGATGASASYDLVAAGLPVVDVKDIPVTGGATLLAIGAHGFTLGLGLFWARAVSTLAIAPRVAAITPDARGLLGAVVAAVVHGGRSGCAGVEDLVCSQTGAAGCGGAVAPACAAALDALGARLDAAFAAPPGIDLTLQGRALPIDSKGDLMVDRLDSGSWTPTGAASATFQGMRTP